MQFWLCCVCSIESSRARCPKDSLLLFPQEEKGKRQSRRRVGGRWRRQQCRQLTLCCIYITAGETGWLSSTSAIAVSPPLRNVYTLNRTRTLSLTQHTAHRHTHTQTRTGEFEGGERERKREQSRRKRRISSSFFLFCFCLTKISFPFQIVRRCDDAHTILTRSLSLTSLHSTRHWQEQTGQRPAGSRHSWRIETG